MKESILIKEELESNRNHLSMCGNNFDLNQTILHMKIYQRSMQHIEQFFSLSFSTSSYFSFFLLVLFFLSMIFSYLITKKHSRSFSNGGTL